MSARREKHPQCLSNEVAALRSPERRGTLWPLPNHAAFNGNRALVEILHDAGADLNARDGTHDASVGERRGPGRDTTGRTSQSRRSFARAPFRRRMTRGREEKRSYQ